MSSDPDRILLNMYRVIVDTVCSRIPDDSYVSIGKEQKPFWRRNTKISTTVSASHILDTPLKSLIC